MKIIKKVSFSLKNIKDEVLGSYVLEEDGNKVELEEPVLLEDLTPEFLEDFGKKVCYLNGVPTRDLQHIKFSLLIEKRINEKS